MKRLSFILLALLAFGRTAWAQVPLDNIPAEVNAEDATITELGHATMTVKVKIVTDSLTHHTDTLCSVTQIEWNTPSGTANQRNVQRGNGSNGSEFYGEDNNSWLDIYWYRFNYPSINAEGRPVLLSALTCMPDEDCDYINNVIIGCHVTITSNKECPSAYTDDNYDTDVSMMMNHAGSGLLFHSLQSDRAYYNLVIMPDYEGYGITRSNAHPYLYQELTARQVVDGVRYGIALYKSSPRIDDIRHPFRDGWRSICLGYSQGGSVAMATQRFIEQNDLTDELQLAGSVCGDGPYDPMATLMYYTNQYNEGDPMSMPVVLPLILKGMCDYNPYMKDHQVSDYLKPWFLNSGILDWLTAKEKTTNDITAAWKNYFGDNWPLKLNQIINEAGLAYFQSLYSAYSDTYTSEAGIPLPEHRGLMEDLHFALASNNLTKGWTPQHALCLYHSRYDTVVPEVNRESAGNSFPDWVLKFHSGYILPFDHVNSGKAFFLGTAEFKAIRVLSKASVHQTTDEIETMKEHLSDYLDEL